MKMVRLLGVAAVTLLSGCSVFTPPKEKPVIQDYVAGKKLTSVFSLTPERRTVIVVKAEKKSVGSDGASNTPEGVLRFCAEPPPDVAEGIASSFRALAEATLQQPESKTNLSAAAELSKSFSTSINTLFYRSQGVQYFRDGLFSLCQAYLNKIIKEENFKDYYETLMNNAFVLILQEIPTAREEKTINAAQRAENARTAADQAVNQATAAKESAEQAANRAMEILSEIKKTTTEGTQ